MAQIILKNIEENRLDENLIMFKSNNEDILSLHNHSNEYGVASIDEFKEQLRVYNEHGFKLSEANIKKFSRYPHGEFIHFTINKKDSNVYGDSDGDMISRIGLSLDFMVCGYTYIMTQHKFNKFKKYLYKNIKIE